jgi:hypothetical protein
MSPATKLKIIVVVLAAALLTGSSLLTKTYWCSKQLDTPIFRDGDLKGKPDRIIARIGHPARRLRMSKSSILTDRSFRDLFLSADLAQLKINNTEILIWEKDCLGSTIWRFAVMVDAESGIILAIGGESTYYAPVYFGGFITLRAPC